MTDIDIEKIGPVLMGALGHHLTSASTSKRHLAAIDALLSVLQPGPLARDLEGRRKAVTARWGDPRAESLKARQSEPVALTDWLSHRTRPSCDFRVLQRTAARVRDGETNVGRLQAKAFFVDGKQLATPVGYEAFRSWVLRTGILITMGKGQYAPGPQVDAILNAKWEDVDPRPKTWAWPASAIRRRNRTR